MHERLIKTLPKTIVANQMTLDIVLMFISFVYQNGRSANTVNTYMGALSFVFKIQGISDVTSH
jgi:hypothetical protein